MMPFFALSNEQKFLFSEYKDGSVKYCTGQFCSETCRNDGCAETIAGHTCSMIRFCYEADSGSDVWLMPDEKALQQCDFSSATQICDTGGGSGEDCCNYKVELDHDLKAYLFASKEGCGEGQRAVVAVDDYNNVGDACFGMGQTSARINKCTCNYEDEDMSTLSEPCHSNFVAGCNLHSPDLGDDTSCCDDATCVGKHQDVTHSIGQALEIERKVLCNDDIPGRCLNEGIFDCCASQCSGCGTDVTPFTEWSICVSGNATAGTGNCGYGGHGGAYSQFECDFTKCTEDHKWHMAGEPYNNWMKLMDPDNLVVPTVDEVTQTEAPKKTTPPTTLTEAPKKTTPPTKPPAPTPTVEEEASSASVNMMHGLTVAISFGMLVSLS